MKASDNRSPKRRDEVLATASQVMRARGIFATRLQDVSDQLGVAHSALYHYFRGRDHMVEEVLCWNLKLRRDQLARASGDSALDRLLDFIALELTEDRERKVRIPAIIALPEKHRQPVLMARESLVSALASLIDEGIAEGSIRPCHAMTVANVIIHALEYFVRFQQNASVRVTQSRVTEIASRLVNLFRHGALADRRALPFPSCHIDRGAVLLGIDPALDPEIDRLEQILRVATRYFNHEGSRATIPRIAADLGVSKSMIYRYTPDKQDLMYQCYMRGIGIIEASNRLASDLGENVLDAILIHRTNLHLFHASEYGPFAAIHEVEYLQPWHQRIVRMMNRGNRETSVRRLRQAIDAGYLRSDIPPDFLQPVMGQAVYGLPSWFVDGYPLTILEVSGENLKLHLQGLAALDHDHA